MEELLVLASDPQAWLALLILTVMEIVLGIDNVVFITILSGKLPPAQQLLARRLGLGLALFSRLGLLLTLSWIMRLTEPLFSVMEREVSGRDLILLGGGLFLVGKAAHEIYENVEHPAEEEPDAEGGGASKGARGQLAWTLAQIVLLDVVFSLDSVITAVGMAQSIAIMVAAMIIAVIVMVAFAGPVGDFVNRHASVKILALSFLVLIGVLLMAEGFGQHVSKGYVYFAMGFSVLIEVFNMRRRRKSRAQVLREEAREAARRGDAPAQSP